MARGDGGIIGGDRSAGGGQDGTCSQRPPQATPRGCGNSGLSSRTAVGGRGGAVGSQEAARRTPLLRVYPGGTGARVSRGRRRGQPRPRRKRSKRLWTRTRHSLDKPLFFFFFFCRLVKAQSCFRVPLSKAHRYFPGFPHPGVSNSCVTA